MNGIESDTAPPVQGAARTTPASRLRGRYRRLPAARAVVQGAFVAFFLLAGVEFHSFYAQVVSGGPGTAPRPPGTEAVLSGAPCPSGGGVSNSSNRTVPIAGPVVATRARKRGSRGSGS